MKRILCCLIALGLSAAAVRAQEPVESELDFVRKMRSRGYIAFAREYLEKLQKRNDPALAAILPLEQARTLLAAAREKPAEQRGAIFAEAREFLKDYVAKNAGKPAAAQGALELGKLSSYEGQALLTKAMRDLETAGQHDKARPAEAKFVEAATEREAAIKQLQALIDDPKLSDDVKKGLKTDLIQARFEKAINFIDQARTYINTSKEDVNLKRAQIIVEAQKVFAELQGEPEKTISAQANAWLMKIAMEQQDPIKIETYYNRVMAEKDAESRAGHRWARLFDMQDALVNAKNPRVAKLKTANEKLVYVQTEGLKWLKDYPNHHNTPEGHAVLWELAMVFYTEAKNPLKKGEKSPSKLTPEQMLDQAQKYFGALAAMEGDFSEKAKQHNLAISFDRMGQKKDVRTFEELYLKGQFELLGLPKIADKRVAAKDEQEKKAAEAEWKGKLKEIASTFGRAVAVANERTPIAKLDDAKYHLTAAYLIGGDLQRAAISGEALARTKPPTRHAPEGAGYAIDAYANLLERDNSDGTKERLQSLIEYVLSAENQKFWASDPVTGVAHYQLAMLHKRDGNVKGAIAELEKLPKEFPAYIYAQGQLLFIALNERKDNTNLTEANKKELTEKMRGAAQRMPALPNDADSTTAFMYFLAQLELSRIMYGDGYQFLANPKQLEPLKAKNKFAEMSKFLTDLSKRFEKLPIKITPKHREGIDFDIHVMQKYADLGQAEVEYREGKFEDVIKVTKPAVDAVKKADDQKGGPIRLKDFQVTGDTLGLALRAQVQLKNVNEAKDLLGLVKRLAGEDDPKEGAPRPSDAIVSNLLKEISQRVKQFKDANDTKGLNELVGSFTGFLDALLKETDAKKMPVGELKTLAEAFSSLGQHGKAAELLAQFPVTKLLESKKEVKDFNEEELRELGHYWTFRLELAREHRKDKQFKEAHAVIKHLLAHKKALFKMPYALMEENFIYEDEDDPGRATVGWVNLIKSLQQPAVNDTKMKQFYFESYFYRVRTLFKYGMKTTDAKKKETFISGAGKMILDLEYAKNKEGWDIVNDRFRTLLDAEPVLKETYDRQKKNR